MSPTKKRKSQKNSKQEKRLRRRNRISKKTQPQDSARTSDDQSGFVQQSDEWIVPLHEDDTAYIHHGHEDSDDHSLCGPQFFCCPIAAALFTEIYPDFEDPGTKWLAMADKDLLEWRAPQRFYFYYCDENDGITEALFFVGLNRADFEDVIQRKTPIHNWDNVAYRITKEAREEARKEAVL